MVAAQLMPNLLDPTKLSGSQPSRLYWDPEIPPATLCNFLAPFSAAPGETRYIFRVRIDAANENARSRTVPVEFLFDPSRNDLRRLAVWQKRSKSFRKRIFEVRQRFSRVSDHLRQRPSVRHAGYVVGAGTPTIFRPTLFTDQRHEGDGAKIFFFEIGLALAGKLDEGLIPLFLTDRNDQATV
jgi:hypothetical protein